MYPSILLGRLRLWKRVLKLLAVEEVHIAIAIEVGLIAPRLKGSIRSVQASVESGEIVQIYVAISVEVPTSYGVITQPIAERTEQSSGVIRTRA